MLAKHFQNCTYVGHTIWETSIKTTSELDPLTNMNDVTVSTAALFLFTLHNNNSSKCKGKEWRFLLLKMASKEQSLSTCFHFTFLSLEKKKSFCKIAMLPACLCFRDNLESDCNKIW
jgi:hypothetical protein